MGIDVFGDEERAVQEFLDDLDERPSRSRSRGSSGGSHGSAKPLVALCMWAFVWIVPSYFLAGPAIALTLLVTHPHLALSGGTPWALVLGSPIAAGLMGWRADRWKRPIDRALVQRNAGLLLGACVVTGVAAHVAFVFATPSLRDADVIWAVTSAVGTFAAWPTVAVISFVLRRRSPRRDHVNQ
jgi:hypothetical protein